jgi:transcriptional regulator with GAF, ATPase, and Fis domain
VNTNRKIPSGLIALKSIVEGTSDHTGQEFFQLLVKNLSQVLDVHGVWITEYLKESNELRALAFWLGGHFVKEYKYKVKNTPCEPVVNSRDICHIPDKVIELFPKDPDLDKLNAVSYMGISIKDINGEVVGHLAMLDNKPMEEIPEAMAIFRIFAARATAEMRRLRATILLEDSERKLKRVFNGVQEAIIEFDDNYIVVQINASGLNLLNADLFQIMEKDVRIFFDDEGIDKLTISVKSLGIKENTNTSLVLQGHLNFTPPGGIKIPTEASLSKYSVDGKNYYALFFHSVHEQVQTKMELEKLTLETSMLKEKASFLGNNVILGESTAIQEVKLMINQVAPASTTVLITGETGTGKELVAQEIHLEGLRNDKPLITLNCAALPAELIESELFGHVKGAFTGATNARDGRFVMANGGTIFLDEIGEMNLALQAKLLRVIQQGEFEPLGSSKTIKVDVRIIAATNRNLLEEVNKGSFREDLYYRLNVFPIYIPPLRARGKDVSIISDVFLNKLSQRNKIKFSGLTEFDVEILLKYHWPGNVRELQNVLERALILSRDGKIDLSYLIKVDQPMSAINKENDQFVYNEEQMKLFEKQNIINALYKSKWKISGKDGAAQILGIPITTLNSRIKKYEISKPFRNF